MGSTLQRWIGYGIGSALGGMLFGEPRSRRRSRAHVRTGTEEDFRRDEERFDEDERRLDAEDRDRASRPSGGP